MGGHTNDSLNDHSWIWTDGSPFDFRNWAKGVKEDTLKHSLLGLKVFGAKYEEIGVCGAYDWCKAHEPGDWACVNLKDKFPSNKCLKSKSIYHPPHPAFDQECIEAESNHPEK